MTRVKITGSRSEGQALTTGGQGGSLTMRNREVSDNWGGISNVAPGHLELYDAVIADNVGTPTGPLGDNGPGAMSNGGTAELTCVSVSGRDQASPGRRWRQGSSLRYRRHREAGLASVGSAREERIAGGFLHPPVQIQTAVSSDRQ